MGKFVVLSLAFEFGTTLALNQIDMQVKSPWSDIQAGFVFMPGDPPRRIGYFKPGTSTVNSDSSDSDYDSEETIPMVKSTTRLARLLEERYGCLTHGKLPFTRFMLNWLDPSPWSCTYCQGENEQLTQTCKSCSEYRADPRVRR